jgi:hypothetical protein
MGVITAVVAPAVQKWSGLFWDVAPWKWVIVFRLMYISLVATISILLGHLNFLK